MIPGTSHATLAVLRSIRTTQRFDYLAVSINDVDAMTIRSRHVDIARPRRDGHPGRSLQKTRRNALTRVAGQRSVGSINRTVTSYRNQSNCAIRQSEMDSQKSERQQRDERESSDSRNLTVALIRLDNSPSLINDSFFPLACTTESISLAFHPTGGSTAEEKARTSPMASYTHGLSTLTGTQLVPLEIT